MGDLKSGGSGCCPADEISGGNNPAITVVGAPNVGKSVIFNTLSKSQQTVSNYPGTTVTVSRGKTKLGATEFELIDTPGMYSLFPSSEEEKVSRDILADQDSKLVLHVVDGKSLKRSLPFTLQLLEADLPVMLVVNMMDEVRESGLEIDTDALAEELGIPVLPLVATSGEGLEKLKEEIGENIKGEQARPDFSFQSSKLTSVEMPQKDYGFSPEITRELLLRGDDEFEARVHRKEPEKLERIKYQFKKLKENGKPAVELDAVRKRNQVARSIYDRSVSGSQQQDGWGEKLGRIAARPLTGWPILFLVIYFGIYKFVGVLGAQTVVDFLEVELFEKLINPVVTDYISRAIPFQPLVDLLVGEYGMITLGLTYALALILPIIAFFFLAFSIIEDSGYLPRLALLLDRTFKKIGLSGRAVIPMVLGLGCDTMATVVTRTLDTRRQRIIATLLLALAIPCSAQLGVILAILSGSPLALFIWAGTLGLVFMFVGFLASYLFPGENSAFYMQLPPLRMPKISNILSKTYVRVRWYFMEIFPLFMLASFFIWLGRLTGLFGKAINLLVYPAGWIGLPPASAKIFLYGFFRRDYGAAGLYDLIKQGTLDPRQIVVASVVLTLFVPCVAQFIVTGRERGWGMALAMGAFVLTFSFAVGYVLNLILLQVPFYI